MSFNKGSENRCQHGAKYMEVYLIEYLCVFFLCVAFFLFMGDDDYPHTQTKHYLQKLLNTSLANALVGNGMLEEACERCSSCAACWPCGRAIDEPR